MMIRLTIRAGLRAGRAVLRTGPSCKKKKKNCTAHTRTSGRRARAVPCRRMKICTCTAHTRRARRAVLCRAFGPPSCRPPCRFGQSAFFNFFFVFFVLFVRSMYF
ncbi:hypothetical protein RND81_02G193600 [Saponaria officinalis]|uniref:Uncharacterized protein n=1 Tax=Saponaria officinalis TaxID=3572 RepID=A0AAW1MWT7_SAPOF